MKKEKLFLQMIKVVICKPQEFRLPCDAWTRGKFFCRGTRLSRVEGERETDIHSTETGRWEKRNRSNPSLEDY